MLTRLRRKVDAGTQMRRGGGALSRDYRNNEQSNSGNGSARTLPRVPLIYARFLIGESPTLIALEGRYVRA